MTKENERHLSPDELIGALRNSTLPTLLAEGRSDMRFYRTLEELCFNSSVDILAAGSRPTLFEVFRRRAEFGATPVAFLADSDLLLFEPVPSDLAGIIFTLGYSIENDVLSGGKAFRFIGAKHRAQWQAVLQAVSHWFASIVHRYLNGAIDEFSQHPSQVVEFKTGTIVSAAAGVVVSQSQLRPEAMSVIREPVRFVRGHTLVDSLGHFLAVVKHPQRCSKDVLLQIDLVSWETNYAITRLLGEVRSVLPGVIK